MKTIKIMLIGIALLLLGVISGIFYLTAQENIWSVLMILLPIAGVITFLISFLEIDK